MEMALQFFFCLSGGKTVPCATPLAKRESSVYTEDSQNRRRKNHAEHSHL